MSWSLGVSSVKRDELIDALDERFSSNYADAHEAVIAQFESAKAAVGHFLESADGELFNVSMNGHSQKAMPESAKDATSVSLSAVG